MRKQSWLSRIMFFLNVVLTIVTFIAYSLPFLAPKAFPFLSVFSLGLPFLLFLNFFFFVYAHFYLLGFTILLSNSTFYFIDTAKVLETLSTLPFLRYEIRCLGWIDTERVSAP